MDTASLAQVRGWLQYARRIAVLTGAGVSAESGVPTFRKAQTGYWAQFRPEDMATEEGFRAHPRRVWDWYQHRRDLLAGVQPNAGHAALADFQCRHPEQFTLITQNVDGLPAAAICCGRAWCGSASPCRMPRCKPPKRPPAFAT